MDRALKKKSRALTALKANIKGLAKESQDIRRKRIFQTQGFEKQDWIDHKRQLGQTTRVFNLAYAFLRGMPYSAVEPNKPFTERLYSTRLGDDVTFAEAIIHACHVYYRPSKFNNDLTIDNVLHWFKTDENKAFQRPKKGFTIKAKVLRTEAQNASA